MDDSTAARLEELLPSAAVIVATRDERLRTHITRAWGPRFDPATGRLEVAIATSDDPAVLSDLEANGAIALTAARPTTYEALQVKGTVDWIGELDADAQARVDAHVEQFLAQVMAVGMTRNVVSMLGTGLVGLRFVVDDVFEQTPGAAAGRPA